MGSAMYLRKSRSDEPSEDVSTTLHKHRSQLEAFAKKNRIAVTKVYEEVVTGDSLFVRPQMIQLLSDVENGLYDAVVCMDIDRLGRGDMKDQGIILETLKFSDTKIVTPEKTYDLNNDLDEELTEFKTFMSRRELKIITKRLQRGLRETVLAGGYISNPPYGYEKTVVERKPTLKIKEDEAYFIRMMFDMYANQGVGCSGIAEAVNALGAKPRRSAAFGRGTVEHIIKNPVYLGKIVWDRNRHIRKGKRGNEKGVVVPQPEENWIVAAGIHPPIIDEALFEKARETLKGRYHVPTNDGTVKNPLAGVVKCAICGSTMQVGTSKGKWSYLKCLTKGCPCASANILYVERNLIDQLEQMLAEIQMDTTGVAPANTAEQEAELAATRHKLSMARKQREHLFDLLEQNVYTIEIFTERSAAVNEKIAALKTLESQQAAKIEEAKIDRRADRVEKIKGILRVYGSSDAQGKNQILKQSLQKIEYRKEKGSAPTAFRLEIITK